MNPINFSIQGQPQGFKIQGQGRLQRELKETAQSQYSGKSLKGPLFMEVTFYIHPPKSLKSRVESGEIIYPLRQPGQIDSMAHLVQKYLQHVAFRDPAQVVDLRSRKIYDLNPRTEIQIQKL